jgi:hypothetical protein
MSLAYQPPGVNIEELSSPSISTILAAPALVAIVGVSQGYIERSEFVTMAGTTAIPLSTLPAGASLTSVTSVIDTIDTSLAAAVNTNGFYRFTNDYTINTGAGTITRVAFNAGTGDGIIPDGRVCKVTYRYVPADYYDPILLDDLGSISQRFGAAWSGSAINSELTYAAQIAFENGAQGIVCQPLFKRGTAGDPSTAKAAPTTASSSTYGSIANTATWSDTLYSLRDVEDVNVLVPVIGQSMTNVNQTQWNAIASVCQDHCKTALDNHQYIVLILGQDSSAASNVAQASDIRTSATTLASRQGGIMAQRTVLINTSKFNRQVPDSAAGQNIFIGGQYVAAAIAGMLAGRKVSQSLTRAEVAGLTGIADFRSKSDMNLDASSGLMVIEQKKGSIHVRHGLTLDTSSVQNSELSVVRAKDRMVESLRDTIDSQIIGKVIADANAPILVKTAVIGVLEGLRRNSDLVAYANVQARLLTLQPTTVEVRFSYAPAFPVNYVTILFSIDLSGAGLTTTT